MFRPITLFILIIVLLTTTGHALADGKIFNKSVTAKVNIPDQEALIHFADGVETMVIQTSFTGEGDEFAWVVPTPSEPEVTASTTGLFPTLRSLTAPKVRHPQYQFYIFVWLVVMLVLGYSGGRFIETLFVTSVVLFLMGVLLPSLGASRGAAAVVGAEVHQRSIVGDYEIAVLSAYDPSSLTAWLDDNGFKTSVQTHKVIQQYISEGWFLTAARLTPEAMQGDKASTHPLAFRFPIDQPVYPLRLTATGSDALDVDLYVFGQQRAFAEGFHVDFCNRLLYTPDVTEDDWSKPPVTSKVTIRHPELRHRVSNAEFVTKLSAILSPADMSKDAVIRWDGEATYVPVRWTHAGAKNIAVNVGWACLGLAVVSLSLVFPKRAWLKQAKGKAVALVFVAVCVSPLIGLAVYAVLPKIEADMVSAVRMRWSSLIHTLNTELIHQVRHNLDEDSTYHDANLSFDNLDYWPINPMTGGRIYVEDSPGNVTIERSDDGWCFTAYGPDGAPLRIDGRDLD